MTVEAFTARLRGVQRTPTGALAFCPGHRDEHKRSLSVSGGADGRLLLKCFVGCAPEAIVAALGLTLADLFPESTGRGSARRIAATYDYRDESGELLYQVVRYEPKDFRPRVPDGAGGWRYALPPDVRRVLYRLPELAEQRRVCWVEGEKDADRLSALGLAATTTQGGSGAWRDASTPTSSCRPAPRRW